MIIKDSSGCLAQGLFRHWLPLGTNSLGGSGHEGRNPVTLSSVSVKKDRQSVATTDKTCRLSCHALYDMQYLVSIYRSERSLLQCDHPSPVSSHQSAKHHHHFIRWVQSRITKRGQTMKTTHEASPNGKGIHHILFTSCRRLERRKECQEKRKGNSILQSKQLLF